jgi:hypothetical protein
LNPANWLSKPIKLNGFYIAEIPTALPTVSTMPVLMVTLPTLSDIGRLAHFKMADCKPEVDYISGMK